MKNYKINRLACICLLILLYGCSDSNPYIGKWESAQHGPIRTLSFTNSEMISVLANGTENKEIVKYKNERGSWLISIDDGKTYISSFEFMDKNTMILKETGVELTFKRAQQSYVDIITGWIGIIFSVILAIVFGIVDIIKWFFGLFF